jgi:hypothetical protein
MPGLWKITAFSIFQEPSPSDHVEHVPGGQITSTYIYKYILTILCLYQFVAP